MIGGLLNSRWPQRLRALPWRIVAVMAMIAAFAVVVLYSAAGGSMQPWALNHALRATLFLMLALALSQVPLALWMRIAYPFYAAVLVALIGVEALGAVSGGSQRWLDLGFIRLQPSEFMKIALVLALARFYHFLPRGYPAKLAGIWPPLAMIGTPAALVMLQPDLGTALAICASGAINLMMVMGLAPVVGIPLPLFSYGGSSMLTIMTCVGIVLAIENDSKTGSRRFH